MIPPSKQVSATAFWGLLQILMLVIGVSGFPMWAHPPFPHESVSFVELICGQILLFGILAPLLTTGIRGLSLAVVLTVPMDELAGLLSKTPQLVILKSFICVTAWMIGWGGLSLQLAQNRRLPLVPMLATLLTVGGSIFDYLRCETQAGAGNFTIITIGWIPLSPLPNICLIIKHNLTVDGLSIFIPLIAFLIASIIRKVYPVCQK